MRSRGNDASEIEFYYAAMTKINQVETKTSSATIIKSFFNGESTSSDSMKFRE